MAAGLPRPPMICVTVRITGSEGSEKSTSMSNSSQSKSSITLNTEGYACPQVGRASNPTTKPRPHELVTPPKRSRSQRKQRIPLLALLSTASRAIHTARHCRPPLLGLGANLHSDRPLISKEGRRRRLPTTPHWPRAIPILGESMWLQATPHVPYQPPETEELKSRKIGQNNESNIVVVLTTNLFGI